MHLFTRNMTIHVLCMPCVQHTDIGCKSFSMHAHTIASLRWILGGTSSEAHYSLAIGHRMIILYLLICGICSFSAIKLIRVLLWVQAARHCNEFNIVLKNITLELQWTHKYYVMYNKQGNKHGNTQYIVHVSCYYSLVLPSTQSYRAVAAYLQNLYLLVLLSAFYMHALNKTNSSPCKQF